MSYLVKMKPTSPSEIIPSGLFDKMKDDPEIQDWHYEFVKYLCLPRALRPSSHYIMGKFGITLSKYYYWLNHPKIIQIKNELSKYFFADYVPDVILAMRNEALSGNPKAAELFLEYTNAIEKEQQETELDNMEYEEIQLILKKIRKKRI